MGGQGNGKAREWEGKGMGGHGNGRAWEWEGMGMGGAHRRGLFPHSFARYSFALLSSLDPR